MPETNPLYPTITPGQKILFPSLTQCQALYHEFRQSSDINKRYASYHMKFAGYVYSGFSPVTNVPSVIQGQFDSSQIVTATGVCSKYYFQFYTQDGHMDYASKTYAAYQSLVESSSLPPSSITFDNLLKGVP